jgi:two-component system, chemotaxis family, sensor kinase CheA
MDTERSKKIKRQFKRYLGDQDAEILLKDAVSDKSGLLFQDTPAASNLIEILANFPEFFDAVEKSYLEYEDRINIATRNLEISSHELTETLTKVEQLNLNINSMLDSLGQALLFFGEDGICSEIYSKSCLNILEMCPAHKHVGEVLHFSADTVEVFTTWLEVVFSGASAMSFDDLKKLLPQELVNSKGAIIELDYKPMHLYDQSLSGVLLIATDMTYQRQAEKKFRALQLEAQKIRQIAMDRNGFFTLISDMYGFLDMMASSKSDVIEGDDLIAFKRSLHTFKGQAGLYSLEEMGQLLNSIESEIGRIYSQAMPSADMHKYVDRIKSLVDEKKAYAQKLFGPDFMSQGKMKTVDAKVMQQLQDIIAQTHCNEEDKARLQNFINDQFLSVQIFELFHNFKREIIRLCEISGKDTPIFNITGDNIPVIPEKFGDFFKVLIHMARNISDHAIEMPDQRHAKGKPRAGHIDIHIEDQSGQIMLRIKDDGRGIDPEAIRSKLQQNNARNISHESDDQIIYHIFDPDFSSKQNADMISGRGIGMNAVMDTVTGLGGKITVISDYTRSKGTEFTILLPHR